MRRRLVALALVAATGCSGSPSTPGPAASNQPSSRNKCELDCLARSGGDNAFCQRTCLQQLPFATPTPTPKATA